MAAVMAVMAAAMAMVAVVTAAVMAATAVTAEEAATVAAMVMAGKIRFSQGSAHAGQMVGQPQSHGLQIEVNCGFQFWPAQGNDMVDRVGMFSPSYGFQPKCAKDRASSA